MLDKPSTIGTGLAHPVDSWVVCLSASGVDSSTLGIGGGGSEAKTVVLVTEGKGAAQYPF